MRPAIKAGLKQSVEARNAYMRQLLARRGHLVVAILSQNQLLHPDCARDTRSRY
jgi:hypothetical protein